MTWSTVIGLAIVAAITATFAKLWTAHCRRKELDAVDARITELDDELRRAIDETPGNIHEHLRLAAELDRLRIYRDHI